MPALSIVVGTGKCGSVELSRLFGRVPGVLSLSEFFTALAPSAFPGGELDGAAFWAVLSTPRSKPTALVRAGIVAPEFTYPFAAGRFTAEDGVPPISLLVLPHLTGDPDALFDELAAEVSSWPSAAVGDHYRHLFSWLAERLGAEVVVERSAASLRFLPDLLRVFPEARIVHLYRAGADCARSMSGHPSFRLFFRVIEMMGHLGVDPYDEPAPGQQAALPVDLHPYLPGLLDGEALMTNPVPLSMFGLAWSQQILSAAGQLVSLPPERVRHVSYESLFSGPDRATAITVMAEFVGVRVSEGLAAELAAMPDPDPVAGVELSGEEAANLRQALQAGNRALELLIEKARRASVGVG